VLNCRMANVKEGIEKDLDSLNIRREEKYRRGREESI